MPPADPTFSPELFTQFLDDYFAECEEHLTLVRGHLLALEQATPPAAGAQPVVDDLFRSFHTIKGLSAMVGLTEAETLAHQAESILREVRQQTRLLDPRTLDLVLLATQALDRTIAARKAGGPIPDVRPVLDQLAHTPPVVFPPPAPAPRFPAPDSADERPRAGLRPEQQTQVQAALAAGQSLWAIEFTPDSERAARGVNVGYVRAVLQAAGSVIAAVPRPVPGRGVVFEFVWAGDWAAVQPPLETADGVTISPYAGPEADLPATPAEMPGEEPERADGAPRSRLVRVDLARLDELMEGTSDLVISRSHLETEIARLEAELSPAAWRSLHDLSSLLGRQLRDLRGRILRVRLVPLGEVFTRLRFAAHDLARDSGKQVQITVEGQETELDKYVVERMLDPLLHLVRNAVSHGLESPEARAAAGKPEAGQLRLSGATRGDRVVIEVADDGRGIDADAVLATARAAGLPVHEGPAVAQTLLNILCTPGFSTRAQADRASGRGVGMDVVRTVIEDLGGSLALDTTPGSGTRFRIELPITLAILDAVIVGVGDHRLAVPLRAVQEIVPIPVGASTRLENNALLPYRDVALPVRDLAAWYGERAAAPALFALVIGQARQALGLGVDRLLGKREIVVRALADPLAQVPGIAGATDLGDGRPVLILDPGGLAQHPAGRPVPVSPRPTRGEDTPMADTTAPSEPYILFELAGGTYGLPSRVVQQVDMVEAITPLPNAPPVVDGVVFVRGQALPALNLRARFGFPRIAPDLRARLLVVTWEGRRVGLVVDTAREFVTVPGEAIQPAPAAIADLSGDYLSGVASLQNRLILLLNLDVVLDIGALPVLDPAAP